MRKFITSLVGCSVAVFCFATEKIPQDLRVGVASHAFDHLGNIGEQADAAAASGVNIIYATGLGGVGYMGLPDATNLVKQRQAAAEYVRKAKAKGIRLAIGYVCATSIVKLDTFDKGWTVEFREQFQTPPSAWRQVARDGNVLPSWYGGDYQPACMNNPDWRTYEKFIVRQQIETGHDGIFFDNPTVHPQGCYCEFCLRKFATFLGEKNLTTNSISALRELATKRPKDFLRYRCTIARDFLADMREYARTINHRALITCNNSLNAPEAFYSQNRAYAYNIYEMSKAEDFVVVEDQNAQPRTLANGATIEYGAVYKLLHAINHNKPVIAVTIADVDYHTAPNLVRLAMAEAAANDSSYLSWPTWPENLRSRMSSEIRPEADLLRQHEKLLNETTPRCDVLLFMPFRRWVDTDQCTPLNLATALTRANVQYRVVCEDDLISVLKSFSKKKTGKPVLLVESDSVLNADERKALDTFRTSGGTVVAANKADWLKSAQAAVEPSIRLQAPPTVRAVVRDQGKRTVVHLYNLNIQKLSSFDDKVSAANDVHLSVRLPKSQIHLVKMLTADREVSSGELAFTTRPSPEGTLVDIVVPKLVVSGILVVE